MDKNSGLRSWLNRHLAGKRFKQFVGIANAPSFAQAYLIFSLGVLLATTIFWSILSARIQSSNADQLVNAYLFKTPSSLSSAIFPGPHSLLLKWPLFALLRVFGPSTETFVAFTVATVLITVAVLALILYRIERRPLAFGTLCLGLASVLLLVPTQPHAGALLPVNMAMIAARNLEYVLFIAAVFLFARSPRLRSPGFWLAVILMGLLVASDRLFLFLGVGGALLALVVYALSSGWNLVSLTVRWLVGGLIAGLGSLAVLWWLNWSGITHISAVASPYGLVHSLHDVVLGGIYGLLGLLTNFGSNPAFSTTVLRDIPHDALHSLIGVSGLAFMVNFVILVVGIFAAWRLLVISLAHNKNSETELDSSSRLSIMLIWASLAGLGLFIISSHNYAGDARYLTIALFALFISMASYSAKRQWRPEFAPIVGTVIVVAILLALPTVVRAYNNDNAALAPANERNSLVSQALKHHQVSVLVGDYWRVLPIKLTSGGGLNVAPLTSCTQLRGSLTSTTWQPNLAKQGFAYLLTLDGSQTDYPNCTLNQIINSYGRPNASTLIAGSLTKPKELLLFYAHGIHKSSPVTASAPLSTVLPITLDQLPHTYCSVPTVMNIVAHEDDDLLFMNPDTLHDIKAGHCIRTVYVTAGDAGNDKFYWLSREQGSEAAYAEMLGISDIWVERVVKLTTQEFITIANPRGNNNVSLIFMHLPDGNLKGQGFKSSNFESLAKLQSVAIPQIQSVDSQSVYSSDQLTAALTTLMHAYQPAEIRTQSSFPGQKYADHSDHMTVGRYATQAYQQYELQQYEDKVLVPLEFYIGYPIHERPPNVSGDDLTQKELIFATYTKFDIGSCQTLQRCITDQAYGAYLTRQYQNNN